MLDSWDQLSNALIRNKKFEVIPYWCSWLTPRNAMSEIESSEAVKGSLNSVQCNETTMLSVEELRDIFKNTSKSELVTLLSHQGVHYDKKASKDQIMAEILDSLHASPA